MLKFETGMVLDAPLRAAAGWDLGVSNCIMKLMKLIGVSYGCGLMFFNIQHVLA